MKKHKKKLCIEDVLIKVLSYGVALFLVIKGAINMFASEKENISSIINNTLKIFLLIIAIIGIIRFLYIMIKYFKEKKN